MQKLKTMDDVPLDGKRVLVRVDFNVTVGKDGIVDQYEDYRLEAALPTLQELQRRRCKIVLLTHLGSSEDESGDFGLGPIARRLSELLRDEVRQLKHLYGREVDVAVSGMERGGVVLLPNVRLDEREEAGSEKFAAELAEVADAYVNEAFSVSHRDHSSVVLVPRLLPSCAGRRTALEYGVLQRLRDLPEHPYVAIMSGSKVHTKVSLLSQLLRQVDCLCLGGRLANVVLAALGKRTSEHYGAKDMAVAARLLQEGREKIVLPRDVVIGPESVEDGEATVVSVEELPRDGLGIWDIGPASVDHCLSVCRSAKTIMWNGPVGKFEVPAYALGTRQLARGLASLSALRVVGGGDTAHALELYHLVDKFDHVSVGGGAMVTMLEGSRMPGLEPLYA